MSYAGRNRPANGGRSRIGSVHGELTDAVRALEDGELRLILVALLREWRDRAEEAGSHILC